MSPQYCIFWVDKKRPVWYDYFPVKKVLSKEERAQKTLTEKKGGESVGNVVK